MKRILLALLVLPFTAIADNYPPIEYGVATTVDFVLYNTDGTLDVDEADAGTEVTAHCDGDAGTTATNDFVDEGSYYSIALVAGETDCARVTLDIAATDRNVVIIPTFGHPLASIVSYEPYKAAGLVDAAGTTSTLELAAGDSAADDFYNGYVGKLVGGTGVGQEFVITDYANTGNVATITTLVTNTSTDSYYIIGTEKRAVITVDANGNVASDVKLAEAVDWTDQIAAGHTTYDAATGTEMATAQADLDLLTGTDGATLATAQALYAPATAAALVTHDGKLDTAQLDLDIVTGTTGVNLEADSITASIMAANSIGPSEVANDTIDALAIATDAIDADALAADAVDEIWAEACEDQGGGYSCRSVMSLLLAEAMGTAVYTSGTRTWVVKDPSGTETRFTLIYDPALDGGRTTSTPAPMTP